ncbi:hypothetical protein BKA61DRAFT_251279 [Leptodontidium sp. MPI-SDFR-AT-0119]|nr:hypothetical protein BKA61DRAFT_251279 [Leptodontidium sp. MPI-SDFR-AT-0119]
MAVTWIPILGRRPLHRHVRAHNTIKSKPVLGVDDLLLLLNHHWARDTSTSPTERHRVQFALILVLIFDTGCRPAELVDARKKRKDDIDSEDDDLEVLDDDHILAVGKNDNGLGPELVPVVRHGCRARDDDRVCHTKLNKRIDFRHITFEKHLVCLQRDIGAPTEYCRICIRHIDQKVPLNSVVAVAQVAAK